ncbi:MAG: DUF1800 domain-containing protein [Nitrospirae bacterium]|nr:DUF1800 domain-containing protein [Nitrospirota bacterium]
MSVFRWDRETVAHLGRRAAFGARREEVDYFYALGPDKTLDFLLNDEQVPNDQMEQALAVQPFDLSTYQGIVQWWLFRMVHTWRPLEEKMTLFWHGHFTSAMSKVQNTTMMLNQNQLLRRHALGNFRNLSLDIYKDPAMLLWLDNATNRVGKPNENFARELMELFTMGVGNYTEQDVREVARAFTGHTIDRTTGTYLFRSSWHDYGTKTVLGQTGNWDGDDIINLLVPREATGRFMARKFLKMFVYEDPEPALIDALARVYFESSYSVKAMMTWILTSDAFYSDRARGALVRNPTELVVNTIRTLEVRSDFSPFVSRLNSMGQALFNPPDVEGFDGGMAWINTSTLLQRVNMVNDLAGNRTTTGAYIDLAALIGGRTFQSVEEGIDWLLETMGIYGLSPAKKAPLILYVSDGAAGLSYENLMDRKGRGLIHLVATLPDYHTA